MNTNTKLATLQTRTKTDPKTGHLYIVEFGFDGSFAARHNQVPYLVVKGEHWAGTPDRRTDRNLISCGPQAEMIAEQFPELAPLLPFHGVSIDGPSGYVDNVAFLAGVRDCWGMLKGQRRQIRNGKTGMPFAPKWDSGQTRLLSMEVKANVVRLFAFSELGEMSVEVACITSKVQEPIYFCPDYLLDIVKACDVATVEFGLSGETMPMLVQGEHYRAAIMPISNEQPKGKKRK